MADIEPQLPTRSSRPDYPPWTGRSAPNGQRLPQIDIDAHMQAGLPIRRQYAKRLPQNNSDAREGSPWTSKALLAMGNFLCV